MTQTREQLLAARDAIDAQIKALDAEPDPLLIEAREICATYSEEIGDYTSGAKYRNGERDEGWVDTAVALAALRRGMELAAPLARAPMGEEEIADLARECALSEGLFEDGAGYAACLAAIRATLSRVPVAAWPDKDTVQKMAARITAEYPDGSWTDDLLIEMARRRRAHMSGEQP